MRGFNDDELVDLLEFGREIGAEVRFIEYMDVGGATHWSLGEVVSQQEMLAKLETHYGPIERETGRGSAPAERFRLRDGTSFGIVASVTEPFLRGLRSQPPDSRRPVVHVSIRATGHRPEAFAAQRSRPRATGATH